MFTRALGIFVLLLSAAAADAQVSLQPAKGRYSTLDKRQTTREERLWEISVNGKRTGATLINLQAPGEKPEITAQFRNAGGQRLFTIQRNRSDNSEPWWATYKYANGRLRLVSSEWEAAGLNARGDYLLHDRDMPYMDPSQSPYQNVPRMRAVLGGKTFDLGIVEKARLTSDGVVQGYFFEDAKGKRSNGHADAGKWYKRYFVWKRGKTYLKNRVAA